MTLLVTIIVVVAVGSILLGMFSPGGKSKLGADVYRKHAELFTAAELHFLSVLDKSIAPGQRILGKVRVADLVSVRPGLSPKIRQIALNRIAQKHVDFVVCSGPSLVPVCAIELNDSSHNSSSAKRRDQFLSSVCETVGLPLVVVKAARSYSPDSIRQQLSTVLRHDAK